MLARIFFGLVSSEPSGLMNFLMCDFVLFLFSKFKKYLVDFSPFSYQVARDRNIIPSVTEVSFFIGRGGFGNFSSFVNF